MGESERDERETRRSERGIETKGGGRESEEREERREINWREE